MLTFFCDCILLSFYVKKDIKWHQICLKWSHQKYMDIKIHIFWNHPYALPPASYQGEHPLSRILVLAETAKHLYKDPQAFQVFYSIGIIRFRFGGLWCKIVKLWFPLFRYDFASAHVPQTDTVSHGLYIPDWTVYLFDGFTNNVTARTTAAVIPRLIGYTCIIVVKDGACRNTVKIHVSRTPQIPTTAQAAGIKETPKPLR